jgi:hypothetical protein
MRQILTNTASALEYAPRAHISKLQVFQNKMLGIITKTPRVTPIAILHEQTGMGTVERYVSGLAHKLYLKGQLNDNPKIRHKG